jgi:histone H3/H4
VIKIHLYLAAVLQILYQAVAKLIQFQVIVKQLKFHIAIRLNYNCNNPLGLSNEDEELTLPRASVNKMIKDALPNIRVANDVREMIMNFCTEFIHLVSSEANQVCMAQQKKTINAEHLLTGKFLIIYH